MFVVMVLYVNPPLSVIKEKIDTRINDVIQIVRTTGNPLYQYGTVKRNVFETVDGETGTGDDIAI